MNAQVALRRDERRVEFGDWQTPESLAQEVLRVVRRKLPAAASVLEPTCGHGSFLKAAGLTYSGAQLVGFDISPDYVARARSDLAGLNARIEVSDFFQVHWEGVLRQLPEPILIVGNPPWVTNSALGSLVAGNLPAKLNFKGHSGFDAVTGKSNFDISEWMLLRILSAAQGRRFFLAMLCKATVARRVMEYSSSEGWGFHGAVYSIDAQTHFSAAVDAVLLTLEPGGDGPRQEQRWEVFSSLDAASPSRVMGVIDGKVYSDLDRFHATRVLEGRSELEWRSGIKHDCARVMELGRQGDVLVNGDGESVRVEPDYLFPLLKGSDIANGRVRTDRWVIVTQRSLGDDTLAIRERAPETWGYLRANQQSMDARKSSIYRGQPPFAMFGVGDYSFASYKVAICGLYKRLVFTVVQPIEGRPVMLDDTSYFLPCETLDEAVTLARVLNGPRAKEFFEARVFWDAKRPVNKALLQALSLDALLRAEGQSLPARSTGARQQPLPL